MYRDEPGVYYSEKGVELDERWGEEAGFPVKANRIERTKRKLIAEATEKIHKQFERAEAKAARDAERAEEEAEAYAETIEEVSGEPASDDTPPELETETTEEEEPSPEPPPPAPTRRKERKRARRTGGW
jgi:hypothetical protein